MSRVFLGGTCNGSLWRADLIKKLEPLGVDYFNPVVDHWDVNARKIEDQEKRLCDYHLYCITPKMTGVYSIAELVNSSHFMPSGTMFCLLDEDEGLRFTYSQRLSLNAVGELIVGLGAMWPSDLDNVAYIVSKGIKSVLGGTRVEA